MNPPALVAFADLANGEVAQWQGTFFVIKCGPTAFVNLVDGGLNSAVDPTIQVLPFPNATLVLN